MGSIANLIIFVALIAAWFFTAKKLAGKNIVLRHLAGLTAGVFAMLASVAIFISLGFIGQNENTQQSLSDEPVVVDQPVAELELAVADDDEVFGLESQAVLDKFVPRMEALVRSGLSMEPLRHSSDMSEIGQCGDQMRKNQVELRALRDELHAKLKLLPSGQSFAHERFEPLYIAEANLIRCVTCVPTALPDCQEAAQALGIKE